MRLGASAAPRSPQASIPILSHKLHPWLCKHSVAQTIPEGSVLQGHPGMLWPICAAGSCLGSWVICIPSAKPSPHAQAGLGSSTVCCSRPWGKVIWYRTCICTGAPERLWGLCLGGDQVWGILGSFPRFSPVHLCCPFLSNCSMSCQCSENLTDGHLPQEHKRLVFKEGVKPSELARNSFGARHSAEPLLCWWDPALDPGRIRFRSRLWRGGWW